MSKADDVFIRQFILVLVLLAAYGVGAAVLGIWIADDAREAANSSERATLERIAPVGRLKLGEPRERAEATSETAEDASDAASASAAAAPAPSPAGADQGIPDAVADDELAIATFKQYCFACHLTGAAEAPRTGDVEAWAPRAANGFDALYQSVLNGKGAMPPRAGFAHLTDDELKAGIRYLLAAANLTAD